MIEHRRVSDMESRDLGWLKSVHHFDADHTDHTGHPAHRRLGSLYGWNEDQIAPENGFPVHFDRDVEIVTYVIQGTILHKDSTGGEGRIGAGAVQATSAGTGIELAELSAPGAPTRMFQIRLAPSTVGGAPAWRSKPFPQGQAQGRFVVLASGHREDDQAVPIRADARIVRATMAAGETLVYALPEGRKAYLVAVHGQMIVNETVTDAGDGVAVHGQASLRIEAVGATEVILADVA